MVFICSASHEYKQLLVKGGIRDCKPFNFETGENKRSFGFL